MLNAMVAGVEKWLLGKRNENEEHGKIVEKERKRGKKCIINGRKRLKGVSF